MPINFNFYSSLLLLPFVHGLIFFVLLVARYLKNRLLSDLMLSGIVLLFVLFISQWMLGFMGWYDSRDSYTTFMFYFPFSNLFLLAPLIYFYFRSLTNQQFRFTRKHFWYFLPAIAHAVGLFYCFAEDVVVEHWLMGDPFPIFEGTKGDKAQGNLWILNLMDYFNVVFLLGFALLTLVQFRKYRKYLVEQFSSTEDVQFTWLHVFLWLMIVAAAILIVFQLLSLFVFEPESYVAVWYKFALWGVLLYAISIGGFYTRISERKALQFEPMEVFEKAKNEENEGETPTETQFSGLLEKVQQQMAEEKAFLNPELNLNNFAQQLGESPNQLSKALNQVLGQNFNDFVNSFRVEEVKEKLLANDMQHLSLLGIAYECGFNSKATFNRVFKKMTGESPSAYQRRHR